MKDVKRAILTAKIQTALLEFMSNFNAFYYLVIIEHKITPEATLGSSLQLK